MGFSLKFKLVLNFSLTHNYSENIKKNVKNYLLNSEKTAKLITESKNLQLDFW